VFGRFPGLHLQDDLGMPDGLEEAAADEDNFSLESADAEIEARLEGLPSSLRSADPTPALEELAELIDSAEGEWASALGSYARSAGIVADLIELLGHSDPQIYALAMRVLANLCSDAVDPDSWRTKEVVRLHNGFPQLLPHCFGEDPIALMYALGAVQNLCTCIEYTEMVTTPLRERIGELSESDMDAFGENVPEALAGLLIHYAEGILININMCEREQTRQRGASHAELQQEEEVERRARAKREWRKAQRQRQPPLAPESPLPPRVAEWRDATWSPFSSRCPSPMKARPPLKGSPIMTESSQVLRRPPAACAGSGGVAGHAAGSGEARGASPLSLVGCSANGSSWNAASWSPFSTRPSPNA